jgi:hypothetical protein
VVRHEACGSGWRWKTFVSLPPQRWGEAGGSLGGPDGTSGGSRTFGGRRGRHRGGDGSGHDASIAGTMGGLAVAVVVGAILQIAVSGREHGPSSPVEASGPGAVAVA